MKHQKGLFIFFTLLGLILLSGQLFFLYLHQKFSLVYSLLGLFFILNSLLISCATILLHLKGPTKIGSKIILAILSLLFVGNLWGLVESYRQNQTLISFAPNFHHVFILRKEKQAVHYTYYNNYYFFFARPKENLPTTLNQPKIYWPTNESALLTYQNETQKKQVYIGTYGGYGLSYYTVPVAIRGVWQSADKKTTLRSDSTGITLNQHSYTFNQIQQFGTTAAVLYRNKLPLVVISTASDFRYEAANSKNQGHLILTEVFKPTAKIKLTKIATTD